ncbi:hypothetical protein Krad_2214 [Kineococcus radiotolerans SRS30216 = ATCC BAA-149]|uniref:Uncharacterized protein n=1 Tax=Kineococcus radiotolerans (strain ATCC BAA-149 / DSM 14245 / SRS30216) TaxID=266940 RepID=A6WA56_KINRD|nr:hypothetical protein Krad_2214 [Kineococcus radiotolerans SRS30216 = ATCC BAA-149]
MNARCGRRRLNVMIGPLPSGLDCGRHPHDPPQLAGRRPPVSGQHDHTGRTDAAFKLTTTRVSIRTPTRTTTSPPTRTTTSPPTTPTTTLTAAGSPGPRRWARRAQRCSRESATSKVGRSGPG